MAVLGVSVGPDGRLEGAGGLRAALAALPPGAPVAVLIHGFNFAPGATGGADPHRSLFAEGGARCWKLPSWPAGLGLSGAGGLAIGFGWPARVPHLGALLRTGRTGLAHAYERAEHAGAALAELLDRVAAAAPGRPVDLIGHSLGGRVALAALPHLTARAGRALGRVILLGAAEFAGVAAERLAGLPRGAQPEILNVIARANDPFDALFERFAPGLRRDRALGAGLVYPGPRWLDLQIDHPD
ncbi:MAG: alpha/beta fold hydrolase, partial [Pseudomonadota bacterium]